MPASDGVIDVRRSTAVTAGVVVWNGPDVVTGWHHHPMHQVEYALAGVAEVETKSGLFLLPPQQAILIPAGVAHTSTLRAVRSISAFFDPALTSLGGDDACVLPAAPVMREMLAYATRWPIDRAEDDDDVARAFFVVFARMIVEWTAESVPLHLPTSDDPLVREIMTTTQAQLRTADAASVARAVGVSERTLRRRFEQHCDTTWRAYVVQSRLLRAMALLTSTDLPVAVVAEDVGFASPSGFVRALRSLTGETPSAYRRRAGDVGRGPTRPR